MVYRYRIAADNRLSSVSDEWLGFARDNGAPELTRERIIGRPLASFLAGIATQHLYYLLFDEVRTRLKSLSVPFRCDGPAVRRSMRLTLTPLENETVELEGRLLWEEARSKVLLLDPSVSRSERSVTICSWCKRVHIGAEWVEVEDAVARLDLFRSPMLPQQEHGICASCSDDLQRAIGANAAG